MIGVVVTVTGTTTDSLFESLTVTFAVPGATALIVMVVTLPVAVMGDVGIVTTDVLSDVTV